MTPTTKVETVRAGTRRPRTQKAAPPRGAHLVGSVPLASAGEVFRAVATALNDHLRRIPDGETGPRSDWIVWQYPVLSSRPQFEVVPPAPGHYRALPRLRIRDGEIERLIFVIHCVNAAGRKRRDVDLGGAIVRRISTIIHAVIGGRRIREA